MQAWKRSVLVAAAAASGGGFVAPADLGAQGSTFTTIERGKYLVAAGDCAACHTNPGGKPFAGGLPIATPFGTIYSTNITPDPQTGIGKYSVDDLYEAMHHGVRRDGEYLYPAFPYPWFTKVTREDVRAMKAYLDTIEPVRQADRKPELPWPLNMRVVMKGWNTLYFHEGEYRRNAAKSDEWNRGAYLVEGLGHCGACHTDTGALGGPKRGERLQGGDFGEHWYAPSLAGGLREGLGNWSESEIAEYLKTGANAHSTAGGPMGDVIRDSTQYMSDADLKAIAVYLKDLPAPEGSRGQGAARTDAASAGAAGTSADRSSADRMNADQAYARGKALYLDNCTGCHMEDGKGLAGVFPALAKSSAVQSRNADTLLHIVLAGAAAVKTPGKPTGFAMPSFDWKLGDDDVAAVVNYIRNAWGNHAPEVDAKEVAKVRDEVLKAGGASSSSGG